MKKLAELARLIRSKNAGPFELTIDIIFDNEADYLRVKKSGIISAELISSLYKVDKDKFNLIYYGPAYSIKITLPRPSISGSFDDTDVYGGQQYGPLVDLPVP